MALDVFQIERGGAGSESVATAAITTHFAKRMARTAACQPKHRSPRIFIMKPRDARPRPSVLPELAQVARTHMYWELVLLHVLRKSRKLYVETFRRLLAFTAYALLRRLLRGGLAR